MTYDGFLLAAVVAELNKAIPRGRIQKVRQHNDTDLTLEIRAIGHTYSLFFSVDARFPRVYLTASSNPVPQQAPNFCMVLRKHIAGAFVTRVEQVGLDRIVRIYTESPAHEKCVLILEIMGKHSNLTLTNEDGKVLGAAKHVGSSISRYRQILPGRQYLPPPGGDKADPRDVDGKGFDGLWVASLSEAAEAGDAKKWLMNTFCGFGPFLAAEVVARVAKNGTVSHEKARDEVLQIADMVRTSSFAPVFVTGESGEAVMAYPMPSVQFPASQQHSRESINEALDTLFRTLVAGSALDDERSQTLTAVRRSLAARKQALKSVERTVSESARAEGYRQMGDILLANLDAIDKGARSVELANFFESDMREIQIELDEKLTAQENAQRYFKRYRKARDAASVAESRRKQVMREIGVLEAAKSEAESAASVESLRELCKMLTEQELLRREVAHEKREDEFGGHRIRRFVTPEDWEILYGENSQANDYLTQRVARPNDVWLHARQIVGAHVIIRTARRKGGVPRSVLVQAAKIAAQNSDAKHSSLVPVDHTLRKHVRKPRGSAPGFVTYRNEKTIDIDPKA